MGFIGSNNYELIKILGKKKKVTKYNFLVLQSKLNFKNQAPEQKFDEKRVHSYTPSSKTFYKCT